MITTGEGGCVTTNKDTLAKIVNKLRSHGITKTDTEFSSSSTVAGTTSNKTWA